MKWAMVAAMMTRTRESDPEAEQAPNESYIRLARQVAPMVAVAVLTAGGLQFGPLGQDVTGGRQEIQSLMIETGKLRLEINHLHERITDISTRRTAQVEGLEKRILQCELEIARRTGPGAAKQQGMM